MADFGDEYVIRLDIDPAIAEAKRLGEALREIRADFGGSLEEQKIRALADATREWAEALVLASRAQQVNRPVERLDDVDRTAARQARRDAAKREAEIERRRQLERKAAQELLTSQQKVRENAERHHGVMLVNMRRERKQALANWRDRQMAADAAQKRQLRGWARIREAIQSASQQSQGLNNVIFQGSQAVEDFTVGFQLGGLQGGIRGAANNIGFILNQLAQQGKISPLVGGITTVGLSLGSVVLPLLQEWLDIGNDLEDSAERQNALADEHNRLIQVRARLAKQVLEVELTAIRARRDLEKAESAEDAKRIADRLADQREELQLRRQSIQEQREGRSEPLDRRAAQIASEAERIARETRQAGIAEFEAKQLERAAAQLRAGGAQALAGIDPAALRVLGAVQDQIDDIRTGLKLIAEDDSLGKEFEDVNAQITTITEQLKKARGLTLRSEADFKAQDKLNKLTREWLLLTGQATEEELRASQAREQFGTNAPAILELQAKLDLIKAENRLAELERQRQRDARKAAADLRKADERLRTDTAFDKFAERRRDILASGLSDARQKFELSLNKAKFEDATDPLSDQKATTLGFDALAKQVQQAALEREEQKQTRAMKLIADRIKKQTEAEEKNTKVIANILTAGLVATAG